MNHPWIDVTRRMEPGMVCWPGRTAPEIAWEKRVEKGDHCNVSSWRLVAHTGTHMDSPLHFVKGGVPIDRVPVETLMGKAQLVAVAGTLTAEEAWGFRGVERLFVATGFGNSGVFVHHPELMTVEAAEILVKGGLLMVGTDRLSVDDSQKKEFGVHHALLGAGCVIIEGLDLSKVGAGEYEVCALPLLMGGVEASPARVLMRGVGG